MSMLRQPPGRRLLQAPLRASTKPSSGLSSLHGCASVQTTLFSWCALTHGRHSSPFYVEAFPARARRQATAAERLAIRFLLPCRTHAVGRLPSASPHQPLNHLFARQMIINAILLSGIVIVIFLSHVPSMAIIGSKRLTWPVLVTKTMQVLRRRARRRLCAPAVALAVLAARCSLLASTPLADRP